MKRHVVPPLLLGLLVAFGLLVPGGCVYYNTFHNANKAFNSAEKERQRTGGVSAGQYNRAIEKALKVVENHPGSKYYDDALFMLGVSYFHTRQYAKADRRFRELLANYPQSGFRKDASLYLARTKLALDEMEAAIPLFDELFRTMDDKRIRADAAMALGKYHYDLAEYDEAFPYFQSVRDSLGTDDQRKQAQTYLADGNYRQFKFQEGLKGYLQLLGMKPGKNEKYHALFRAAQCAYNLGQVETGQTYLDELIKDPVYFDSLSMLQLQMAEGFERDERLDEALDMYEKVATTTLNKALEARAWYRMGLIYQFDMNRIPRAKDVYDKAVKASQGTEDSREAMLRLTDIGKLEAFTQSTSPKNDSVLTDEQINRTADYQYQLADLYWFQLNQPDSAIAALEHLLATYPQTPIAPKGVITLSQMVLDQYGDTVRADSLLRSVLTAYPRSDYIPQVLEHLGLTGTAADTGYPSWYIRQAERAWVDDSLYDSALYYYQYVIDSFPKSPQYERARIAKLWVTEQFRSPGDSTLVWAYVNFADSFPSSTYASYAEERVKEAEGDRRRDQVLAQAVADSVETDSALAAHFEGVEAVEVNIGGGTAYVDPRKAIYLGPKGETIILLDLNPMEIEIPFEFPELEASKVGDEFDMYFQIVVDFTGRVVDDTLRIPSESDEINRRASETVRSMIFDPSEMTRVISKVADVSTYGQETGDPRGRWFVYRYRVTKPRNLR